MYSRQISNIFFKGTPMRDHIAIAALIAFLSMMVIPGVSAQDNSISVQPDDLWYSYDSSRWIEPTFPQINVNAYCNQTEVEETYIRKGSYASKLVMQEEGENNYSAWQDVSDIYKLAGSGKYTVSTACGNDTISDSFDIHLLRGVFENIEGFDLEGSGPIYLGSDYLESKDDVILYITLYDIMGDQKREISIEEEIKFSKVYMEEDTAISFSDIELSSDNYGRLMILVLNDINDKGISIDKGYTFMADAEYRSLNSTKRFTFKASRPVVFGDDPGDEAHNQEDQVDGERSFSIEHDGDILIGDETGMTVEIDIDTENIDNFSIDEDDIEARIYEEGESDYDSLEIKDADLEDEDDGIWHIDIDDIPELEPSKEYELEIRVEYDGMREEETVDVRKGLLLKGSMKNSNGVVVPCDMEFMGPSEKEVSVSSNGNYEVLLVPGDYDIILTYKKFTDSVPLVVKIDDVEIDKDNIEMAPDPIRYSHYSEGVSIDDMAVANLLELQLALPYSSAEIKMPYDESKIYDDNEIEVYRCTNWMGDRKDCVGTWSYLDDIAINTINNFISFRTERLSSFVISGKKTLDLEIEDIPDRYYLSEEIKLTGEVTDTDGMLVKNALVRYCIEGIGHCDSVYSDEFGSFETSFDAPSSEGKYELDVMAIKSPYHSTQNVTFNIEVEKKKDLSIELPDMSYVVLDGKSKVSFRIRNTGQQELTGIRISSSAQGLSRNKYVLEPDTISSLGPDEEQEIVMDVPLTKDYCQEMGCMTMYSFSVELSANELDDKINGNLIVEVRTDENDTTGQENTHDKTEESQGNSSDGMMASFGDLISGASKSSSEITGMAVFNSSDNSYVIIFTLIVCFIIIALKKRNNLASGSIGKSGVAGMNPAMNAIKRHVKS